MDFQKFVDGIYPMTCVLSVEKRQDGRCGEIRIVTGNKRYIDSIERPVYDGILKQSVKEGAVFVPNSLYYKYVPRNPAFEDLCYRAAVLKEPVHTYVHPNKADLWFNVFVMPLEYEKGDLCYKLFTERGFQWGGDWTDRQDYQHFDIPDDKLAEWYPQHVG